MGGHMPQVKTIPLDRLGVEIKVGDTVVILRNEDDDWMDDAGEIAIVEKFASKPQGIEVLVRGENINGWYYHEDLVVAKAVKA